MATVIIRNTAFVNMVVSTLEVYKKEAYGVLIGKRQGKDYVIRHAMAYQSAKRHYDWAVMDPARRNRMDLLLKCMLRYRFIGDYHSHIDWPEHLSDADKKEMREESIPLSLLIFVKDAVRRVRWRYLESDRSLTGTIADRYYVKVYAFEYDPATNRIRKLRVRCPYVQKLNKNVKMLDELGSFVGRSGRNGKAVKKRR